MVIPEEIKKQLLFHHPKAKFKISFGLYYGEELEQLGEKQFFLLYPQNSTVPRYWIKHSDGSLRWAKGNAFNSNNYVLVKRVSYYHQDYQSSLGYLIEII